MVAPLGAVTMLRRFHCSVYASQSLVRHGTNIVKAG